jgi:imidazolonepropionase
LAAARKPPIAELRAAKARIAIASDCNPGSAPGASLLLAASMGTRLFGLTTDEALRGMTLHAAQALGLAAECGSLARGLAADFVVWDVESLDEFGYWSGFNRCRGVVRHGRLVRGHVAKG